MSAASILAAAAIAAAALLGIGAALLAPTPTAEDGKKNPCARTPCAVVIF